MENGWDNTKWAKRLIFTVISYMYVILSSSNVIHMLSSYVICYRHMLLICYSIIKFSAKTFLKTPNCLLQDVMNKHKIYSIKIKIIRLKTCNTSDFCIVSKVIPPLHYLVHFFRSLFYLLIFLSY